MAAGGANFRLRVSAEIDDSSLTKYKNNAIAGIREIAKAAAAARASGDKKAQAAVNVRAQTAQAQISESIQRIEKGRTPQNSAAVDAALAELRADLRKLHTEHGVQLLNTKQLNSATRVLAAATTEEAARIRRGGQIDRAKTRAADADPEKARQAAERDARRIRREEEERAVRERRQGRLDAQERDRARLGLPAFGAELTERERGRILRPHLEAERVAEREQTRPVARAAALKGDISFVQDVVANTDNLRALTLRYVRLQEQINEFKERERELVRQQARLSQRAIELTAQEQISRTGFKGNVAEYMAGDPEMVARAGLAASQQRLYKERVARETFTLEDDERTAGTPGARARQNDRINTAVLKKTVSAEESAEMWQRIEADDRAQAAIAREGRARAAARAGLGGPKADEDARFRQDEAARKRRLAAENLVFTEARRDTRTGTRRAEQAANQAASALESGWKRQVVAKNRAAAEAEREAKAQQRAADQASAHTAAMARPASWYQRLQAGAHNRTGQPLRAASDFPTARQGLTQGVISAARFGAGAGLLYGGIATVKEMVKESSDLERVFNQIERQFEATDRAADFSNFRKEIVSIAKETGQMATEVAFVGFQFQGAFGNVKDGGSTAYALEQTRSAIEIAKVTGLELNELVDSLTASSIAFGKSIEEVGDKSLGIQERFGVQAKETLKFFGDLSAVAGDAGLSLDQLAAIAGVAQQATGRSGAALAEGLGRIIPGIQEASVKLVGFYSRTPQLAHRADEVAGFAGKGETGKVLDALIHDYDKLDAVQKKQVISLLGGRREAQVLIPVLENSAKYIREMEGAYSDTGKQASYFADLQKTLAQQVAQLAREFEAFGQKLFEAGLADLLKDIIVVAGGVLAIVLKVAEAFNAMNQATGGLALKLAELVLVMKALQALGIMKFLAGAGGALASRGVPFIGPLLGAGRAGVRGPAGPGGFTMLSTVPGSADAVAMAGGRVAAARAATRAAWAAEAGGAAMSAGAAARAARVAARTGAAAPAVGRAAAGRALLGRGAAAGGAGLAALGVTPVGLAVVAGVAVGATYFKKRGEVQSSANKLADQLKKADTATLEAIAKDKASFWETVAIRGSGKELPAEMAAKQLRINAGEPARKQVKAALDSGLMKEMGPNFDAKRIDDLLNKAAEGDKDAQWTIDRVLAHVKGTKGVAAVEGAVAQFEKNSAADKAASRIDSGELTASVESASAAYEAGAINARQYMETLDNSLADFRKVLAKGGSLTEKGAIEYARIMKQQSAFVSGLKRKTADFNLQMAELGGEGGPEATVSTLTGLLRDPEFKDTTERSKAAKDIVDAQKAIMDQRLAMTDDAEEQLAIMREGFTIDDSTRAALLAEGAAAMGSEWAGFLEHAAATVNVAHNLVLGTVEQTGELAIQWARTAVEMNISLRQAAMNDLNAKLATATAEMNRFAQPGMDESSFTDWQTKVWNLEKQIGEAGKLPDYKAPPKKYVPPPEDFAKKEQEVARERKRKAEEAAREAETERKAAARARLALAAAEHEGDPVALANIQIQEADLAYREATKDSERINAQAQKVKALKARQAGMFAVGDAYRSLNIALAHAAGDTVKAARYEVEGAEAALADARARGDRMGEIAAQADLVSRKAAERDTTSSEAEAAIDTALALERKTTNQAIAELQLLQQVPGTTQKRIDELELKIRELRKGASSDMGWNIPTEIKLPTLYEVRRANQTGAQGQGYQDNRNITVNFTANNTADAEGIANTIVDRFSGPSRYGATPRSF